MHNTGFSVAIGWWRTASALRLWLLIALNLAFNIVANAGFKLSAESASRTGFLLWQVVGNLAGLITVLTLTAILRLIPLHVAYPLTVGLAVIGVQVFAAHLLFHEAISPRQWVGTLVIAAGIALIGGR